MVDGASLLAAMFSGFLAAKSWSEERGSNVLDTGAPWYDVYETKDGKHVSIGAIEARFFEELLQRLQLEPQDVPAQHRRSRWAQMRKIFSATFANKTHDEWCKVFEGSDACFAPVLSFSEARSDAHSIARDAFVEVGGVAHPAPAPRFSRTLRQCVAPRPSAAQAAWQASPTGASALRRLSG